MTVLHRVSICIDEGRRGRGTYIPSDPRTREAWIRQSWTGEFASFVFPE